MEKTVESKTKLLTRIILTGPECTGKTALTIELSARYGTIYIPEYAREYIENLSSPYTYDDVIHIAQKQVELMEEYSKKANRLVFIDTYLIITKVWLQRVYGVMPDWIDNEILKTNNDLYLLCKPDIPWEPDGVRENGGEMREVLFHDYENELIQAGLHFAIVDGKGHERANKALKNVEEFLLRKV
jgi:nicotinamide riboside kinase